MITKKELNDEIINETNTDYDNINLIGFKKSPILETKRNFNLAFIIKMTIMAALGGFLFGYDTGVIGGASLYFYMDFPNITPSEKETIVSLTVIGAAGGCVLIGPILDNYGRKLTIIISDLLFIVGAILMFISNGITMLMAGRLIAGLGVGGASMVIPIYLAEASPISIRGRIVTCNVLFITLGQLIAYFIVLACKNNWRLMLGISGIPALFQLICMFFFPESPKWLLKMERNQEAKKVFSLIFTVNTVEGKEEMDSEIAQIKESMELEDVSASQYVKYKELFIVYRKIVFIGVMLQVWQQLSGINTMMYYGPSVMFQAGFGKIGDEISTIYAAIPLCAVNCLGTIVAILIVDNLGRRYIMLRTLPGCGISMFLLGLGMYLLNSNNSVGQWIASFAICSYLTFFSIGMGSTPWTVNSEIYPLHLRGIGNSMSTLGNWLGNYIVSAVFLSATETDLGEVITYFVIGLFCFFGWLFIFILLPETKGKNIDENINNIIPNVRSLIKSFQQDEKGHFE